MMSGEGLNSTFPPSPKNTMRPHLRVARIAVARAADSSADLAALTLKQASDRIRSKKVSPVELTEACPARIKTYNPKIDAWITVLRESALAQAKVLEKEQAAGRFRSPLHGIPIGLKDNIDIAGTRTTAGSKTLAGNVPTEDADVTRRLLAAGARADHQQVEVVHTHQCDGAGQALKPQGAGPAAAPRGAERLEPAGPATGQLLTG